MDNRQTAFVGLSFLAIGLMIGLVFSNGLPTGNNILGAEDSLDSSLQDLEFVSVSVDDDAALGSEDAPVTIVEFSDFQCPYCYDFHVNTFPLIKENYIDTGLVRFVYRDFPIEKHPNALPAAIAAECAGEVGGDEAYYSMHDMIFDTMGDWYYEEDVNSFFLAYAEELGLDIATCIEDPAIQEEVEADYVAARSYGVGGTPTFFINGKKLVGAYPYDVFETLIEAEL